MREKIKAKVNEAGLWAPTSPPSTEAWAGLLVPGYMYEIWPTHWRSPVRHRRPNSGNASILVKYGTEEQKRKWLLPLIDGTMESGFR